MMSQYCLKRKIQDTALRILYHEEYPVKKECRRTGTCDIKFTLAFLNYMQSTDGLARKVSDQALGSDCKNAGPDSQVPKFLPLVKPLDVMSAGFSSEHM